MALRQHAVRRVVAAVAVSLLCASAAAAQTPAPGQASNLQAPKCLRRDSPPLITMCSLGLDLHPIDALRERRGAADADVVAASFEQLGVLGRPGDTVALMDASGSSAPPSMPGTRGRPTDGRTSETHPGCSGGP